MILRTWFKLAALVVSCGTSGMVHASEIVGLGSNCLDVTGGATADGTRVQMWECVPGEENQQWTLDKGRIVWSGTNKCLDVRGGERANGTKVQIWKCERDEPNQQWTIDGNRIVWTGTKKCLDVSAGGTSNGTDVQIWDCQAGNKNQAWTVKASRAKSKSK